MELLPVDTAFTLCTTCTHDAYCEVLLSVIGGKIIINSVTLSTACNKAHETDVH